MGSGTQVDHLKGVRRSKEGGSGPVGGQKKAVLHAV